MSYKIPLPNFANPPGAYDQRYMQDLTRALNGLVFQLSNPGPARHSQLTLTNLPTSPTGLEPGSVYLEGGVLRSVGNTVNGGGLTLVSPDGTVYVLSVDNAGNLVVT